VTQKPLINEHEERAKMGLVIASKGKKSTNKTRGEADRPLSKRRYCLHAPVAGGCLIGAGVVFRGACKSPEKCMLTWSCRSRAALMRPAPWRSMHWVIGEACL